MKISFYKFLSLCVEPITESEDADDDSTLHIVTSHRLDDGYIFPHFEHIDDTESVHRTREAAMADFHGRAWSHPEQAHAIYTFGLRDIPDSKIDPEELSHRNITHVNYGRTIRDSERMRDHLQAHAPHSPVHWRSVFGGDEYRGFSSQPSSTNLRLFNTDEVLRQYRNSAENAEKRLASARGRLDDAKKKKKNVRESSGDENNYDSTIPADHWLNQPIKRELKWYEKPKSSQNGEHQHYSTWNLDSGGVNLMRDYSSGDVAKKELEDHFSASPTDTTRYAIVGHPSQEHLEKIKKELVDAHGSFSPHRRDFESPVGYLNRNITHVGDSPYYMFGEDDLTPRVFDFKKEIVPHYQRNYNGSGLTSSENREFMSDGGLNPDVDPHWHPIIFSKYFNYDV